MENLNIVYGMVNFGVERESAKGSFEYIMNDIKDIRHRYITLGFHLNEFRTFEYYKDFGYITFEEFCEKNIPLDKSAISRCINVWDVFCARDKNRLGPFGRKIFLDDKWKDYSYSQLCEMISMSDDQRNLVKPNMTIKEIRELKKKVKTSQKPLQVATSQPVEDNKPQYESFEDSNFITELLMQCKLFVFRSKVDSIISSELSGKRFSFEASNGDKYIVQYSVVKKKES